MSLGLAGPASLGGDRAEAACSNNAPASNETVNCSGATTTGVIAPASTGVQLNLLTGGSIIPSTGSSISLGSSANIDLQANTTTGNAAIANTYAIVIGNSSTVAIDGTILGQGGINGTAFPGFSDTIINLHSSGIITTTRTGGNYGIAGGGGGNTFNLDGTIHATGVSGGGIAVGDNDVVKLNGTASITADAGDTAIAIDGFGHSGVQVTTAANTNITVNGLGFLGAVNLGSNAHLELSGTLTSTGSAITQPGGVILGGISVTQDSFVWLKEGGKILIATDPSSVLVNPASTPAISTSSSTGITNSIIKVDGLIENHAGAGLSIHTGDTVTVGATGKISVLGGASFTNAIGASPNTTTTDHALTIDIAGRVENLGTGRGIFISADNAPGHVGVTPLTANITIEQGGTLYAQSNMVYTQDDGGGGSYPAVIDNFVVKGTVQRGNSGTAIDLNDGADTITIFPTATIIGGIKGGTNTSGPENDAFILDGATGTTGTFDFGAVSVTQFETFKKQGAGTWTLTGTGSFATTASVDAGTLLVNGALTAPTITVASGATIGGTGTLTGAVTVNGNVAPGNSIGALNVSGSYTQASGSTYKVEINPTTSDLVNLTTGSGTGIATIQGNTTVSVTVAPGFYTVNHRYTILTASVSRTGTFTNLVDDAPFIDFELNYDANNVFLDITRSTVPFREIAQTRNQIASAGAIEALGAGNAVFDAALFLDTSNALRAFDLLSGEIHASIAGTLLDESRFIRDAVIGRMRQSTGGAESLFAPRLATLRFSGDDDPSASGLLSGDGSLAYAKKERRSGGQHAIDRALMPAPPVGGPVYAAWGQTLGNWGRTGSDGNAASLTRSTGGFFTGTDVTFLGSADRMWRVGLAGGYQRTTVDVADRASSGSIESYHLAAYGGTQQGPFGVRTGAALSWHDIGASRGIAFPGFSDATRASYDARTAQAFGELGYALVTGRLALEPFGRLAYVNVQVDGFRETGGAAALVGAGGTLDTTFSTLGLRAATPLPWFRSIELIGKGSVGWRHAFGTVTPVAELAFASNASTPFVVAGVPIARDAAALEFGFDGRIGPSTTFGVSYVGQVGSAASDHGVTGNLLMRF